MSSPSMRRDEGRLHPLDDVVGDLVALLLGQQDLALRVPSPRASARASPAAASSRRSVFWPAWLKRSKKTLSLGTSDGRGTGPSYQSARTSAIRDAACPSHFSGGCGGFRGRSGQQARDLADAGRVEAEQCVGAGPHGHRPLGVVAQGEAGDAQERGLLLDPAGVGQDGGGVGLQREEVEIADRVHQAQPLRDVRAHHLPGPRMDREDDRDLGRDLGQRRGGVGQERRVDEGRAVERDEQVGAGLDPVTPRRRRARRTARAGRRGCRSSCCRRSASARRRLPRRAGS